MAVIKTENWKDVRIKEINNMGYLCDDSHPCFEEVQEIYGSKAETYEEFKTAFDMKYNYCAEDNMKY